MSADMQDVVATIERAFAAIGNDDKSLLEEIFCEDFHAFENGISMTGPELFELMSRYHAQGRRYQWSVNSPQVEVQGSLGVAVYVNRGFITETRQEGRWRLAFLHSTRMPQSPT